MQSILVENKKNHYEKPVRITIIDLDRIFISNNKSILIIIFRIEIDYLQNRLIFKK